MHILDREQGGFVVPVDWTSERTSVKMQNGKGGQLSAFGMNVNHDFKDFKAYCQYMAVQESELKDKIGHDDGNFVTLPSV